MANLCEGVGAREEQQKLERLVGQITGFWAQLEDQLFNIFQAVLANGYANAQDLAPFRAVFFTFSSYESKMRLTNNAMKARHGTNEAIMAEWRELKKSLDDLSDLRNEIAHLAPMAKAVPANTKAIVRLVPPFWKSYPNNNFDETGYSWAELDKAVAPFWGRDPDSGVSHLPQFLTYRLQEFNHRLVPLIPAPQDGQSGR